MSEKGGELKFKPKVKVEPAPDELASLRAELADRDQRITELEKELLHERTDSLTGLLRRDLFFKNLGLDLHKVFEKYTQDIEELSFDQFTAILQELAFDNHPDMPTVMMADMSFLSLANRASHEGGDNLLRAVGASFRENGCPEIVGLPVEAYFDMPFVAFRHGGDEITSILAEHDYQKIRDKGESLQATIQNISNPEVIQKLGLDSAQVATFSDTLERYGVKPDIDFGVASFAEAAQGFAQYCLELQAEGESISPDTYQREFLDFWLEIADRRTNISKGVRRVELLMDLRQAVATPEKLAYRNLVQEISTLKKNTEHTPEEEARLAELEKELGENPWQKYLEVLDYAKKGSYNTTEAEFDQLTNLRKSENWNKIVLEHILKKMDVGARQEIEREINQAAKKQRIIRQIADQEFGPDEATSNYLT